jgi:radical SAM superfamily enzyme YgiQ (UPF0313 family)
MNKKIILIQPGIKQSFGFGVPPLSLLPLAGTLKDAGYRVEIFDARRRDYKTLDLKDTLCVGITVITGSQINHALAISRFIRKTNTKIPIVWGGVHPSMLPIQTAENKFVDIVVKGEGELTLLELVKALEKNKSLQHIQGITYREHGKTRDNPARPFMDFNKAALPPYELLKDISTYEKGFVHIQTSRGCPHNCGFCYNKNFNKYSYRYKNVDRVLFEIEWAIKNLGAKHVHFDEDNFFVIPDRVKKICEDIIRKKLNITWSTTCRLDYFSRYGKDFLKLLRASGCKSLAFGGESGSQRILDYVKKDITAEQTIKAIENARDCDIVPILSFVCGFPTETKKDTRMTLDLISKLMRINKKFSTNGIFVFTPYPGTPLFEEAVKHGFKEPKSLEEWGKCYFGDTAQTPWLSGKYEKYIRNVSGVGYLLFSLPNPNFKVSIDYFLKYALRFVLHALANMRFKLRFFDFPIELELYERHMHKLR